MPGIAMLVSPRIGKANLTRFYEACHWPAAIRHQKKKRRRSGAAELDSNFWQSRQ
jgi:hypothetical protein